ncbi:MAG: 4Fe-4S cluster-binding domain-containing protein [Methanomassiliicoccaceae archaeon]|nr:4Fe-4S cluster-binding domain-containing protein [Methanomassiliicoccaceae archaeon]
MIRRLEGGSAVSGILAKGCEHCINGSKMVLFITGECGTGCFYCPVSNEKKGNDVIFANEKRVACEEDIIAEAVSMDATGTGITGGDPLTNMDRTLRMIHILKEKFGKEHHIHLYTSTIDLDKTMALEAAGLDEIRFHPPVSVWECIGTTDLGLIVSSVRMDVGIEVPALLDVHEDLEKLVGDAISLGVNFVNINELEFSESNWQMMNDRGYELKDELSSAILGSESAAKRIMKKFSDANIHFCSSSFKDSVQLRKRLIRTAEHIAKEYDVVTEDGTILKGLIYADDLEAAAEFLRDEYDVPDELMLIDPVRKRIETASWILEEIASELPFKCYIVEEYPTADRLEVERTPL